MKEISAPIFIPNNVACVFLAGSIEMGAAELWQDTVVKARQGMAWTILNPRRDDWDSSWEQKISNHQVFEQVSWELQGLEQCEKIIIYFDPNTKSPNSLLELGYVAGSAPEKATVVCPRVFGERAMLMSCVTDTTSSKWRHLMKLFITLPRNITRVSNKRRI